MENNIKNVYEKLHSEVEGIVNQYDLVSFIPLIIKLTQEEMPKISGEYKKEVVLCVLELVVEKTDSIDDETKEKLKDIIGEIFPIVIDTMIGISKNEIDLGKNKLKLNCLPTCF